MHCGWERKENELHADSVHAIMMTMRENNATEKDLR
jgi:hypothetical protein